MEKTANQIAHVNKEYHDCTMNKTSMVVVCKAFFSSTPLSQSIESLREGCDRKEEATLILKG